MSLKRHSLRIGLDTRPAGGGLDAIECLWAVVRLDGRHRAVRVGRIEAEVIAVVLEVGVWLWGIRSDVWFERPTVQVGHDCGVFSCTEGGHIGWSSAHCTEGKKFRV